MKLIKKTDYKKAQDVQTFACNCSCGAACSCSCKGDIMVNLNSTGASIANSNKTFAKGVVTGAVVGASV